MRRQIKDLEILAAKDTERVFGSLVFEGSERPA